MKKKKTDLPKGQWPCPFTPALHLSGQARKEQLVHAVQINQLKKLIYSGWYVVHSCLSSPSQSSLAVGWIWYVVSMKLKNRAMLATATNQVLEEKNFWNFSFLKVALIPYWKWVEIVFNMTPEKTTSGHNYQTSGYKLKLGNRVWEKEKTKNQSTQTSGRCSSTRLPWKDDSLHRLVSSLTISEP